MEYYSKCILWIKPLAWLAVLSSGCHAGVVRWWLELNSWELAGLLSLCLATKIPHAVSPHGPGWTSTAWQPRGSGTAYTDTCAPTQGSGPYSLSLASIASYEASLAPHSLGYEQVAIPLKIQERAIRFYLFLRKWQDSSIAYVIAVASLENMISHRQIQIWVCTYRCLNLLNVLIIGHTHTHTHVSQSMV